MAPNEETCDPTANATDTTPAKTETSPPADPVVQPSTPIPEVTKGLGPDAYRDVQQGGPAGDVASPDVRCDKDTPPDAGHVPDSAPSSSSAEPSYTTPTQARAGAAPKPGEDPVPSHDWRDRQHPKESYGGEDDHCEDGSEEDVERCDDEPVVAYTDPPPAVTDCAGERCCTSVPWLWSSNQGVRMQWVVAVRECVKAMRTEVVGLKECRKDSRRARLEMIEFGSDETLKLLCDEKRWADRASSIRTFSTLDCQCGRLIAAWDSLDLKAAGPVKAKQWTGEGEESIEEPWDVSLPRCRSQLQRTVHAEEFRIAASRVAWQSRVIKSRYVSLKTAAETCASDHGDAVMRVNDDCDQVIKSAEEVERRAFAVAGACDWRDAREESQCLREAMDRFEDAYQHYACEVNTYQYSSVEEQRLIAARYLAASTEIGARIGAMFAAAGDIVVEAIGLREQLLSHYQCLEQSAEQIRIAFASGQIDGCGRARDCGKVVQPLRDEIARASRHAELVTCQSDCGVIETQYAFAGSINRQSIVAYEKAVELGIDVCAFGGLWAPLAGIRQALREAARPKKWPVTEGVVEEVAKIITKYEQDSADECNFDAKGGVVRVGVRPARKRMSRQVPSSGAPAEATTGAGLASTSYGNAAETKRFWEDALAFGTKLLDRAPADVKPNARQLVELTTRERDNAAIVADGRGRADKFAARTGQRLSEFFSLGATVKHLIYPAVRRTDYDVLCDEFDALAERAGTGTKPSGVATTSESAAVSK